jgi:tRNA threonylcarbamoyl adenosine modification protein (Sua5/YciO/YrdC/YwlC family)
MARLISINPYNPDPRLISEIVRELRDGKVVVLPTDTVYSIVCCADKKATVQRLLKLKRIEESDDKKPLSVMFRDISMVSDFVSGMSNAVFRTMKRTLPGPYTYILNAPRRIAAAGLKGRATIGVRIPDDPTMLRVLGEFDGPLLGTSVIHEDPDNPLDDPIDISRVLDNLVDLVVDVGPIFPEPSTVVDFTEGYAKVLREGKGSIDFF